MTGRPELRRYLVSLAASDTFVVWAEFVDQVWRTLAGGRPWGDLDIIRIWRAVRRPVLAELAALGLVARVVRTMDADPLRWHDGRVAGLIRVQLRGCEDTRPRVEPTADAHEAAYRRRMAEAHGLEPAPSVDRSLRGFCGQHAPSTRLSWMDHARTWVDRDGELVLTVEPYQFDPMAVAQDLAGIPLRCDGRYPGVWSSGTALLLFRHDFEALQLPAIHESVGAGADRFVATIEQIATLTVDEWLAVRWMRQNPPAQLTRQSLRNLLATVHAGATEGEQWELLKWASGRLHAHHLAGHISGETMASLVESTAAALGHRSAGQPLAVGHRSAHQALASGRQRCLSAAHKAAEEAGAFTAEQRDGLIREAQLIAYLPMLATMENAAR